MPKISILNAPAGVIDRVVTSSARQIEIEAYQKTERIKCPHCKTVSGLRNKGRISRRVRHVNLGETKVYVRWLGSKYKCLGCSRYFNERFPGLLSRRQYTEAFRKEVVNQHSKGIPGSTLSSWRGVSDATIERWYQDLICRKNREYQYREYPEYLGIDEHSFSKRIQFSTTLVDLNRHRVIDVLPGKSSSDITPLLMAIPGRDRVQMVCMDLSNHYRSIVRHLFPNARIVADRFHVIRLINDAFIKTWLSIDPDLRYSRRGPAKLLRKHHWSLSADQLSRVHLYLDRNPAIRSTYLFKQRLCKLLSHKSVTQQTAKRLAPLFIQAISQLRDSHFDHLLTLASTLDSWSNEIACMWRFTKSNSITEGLHRKMKLIQRRAYGFKNFNNYRLRVRALCGSIDFTLR